MEALIEQYLGNPLVLAMLLFLAPFVLEEAAILTGAALAASGEMPTWLALAAIAAGMIASDWLRKTASSSSCDGLRPCSTIAPGVEHAPAAGTSRGRGFGLCPFRHQREAGCGST